MKNQNIDQSNYQITSKTVTKLPNFKLELLKDALIPILVNIGALFVSIAIAHVTKIPTLAIYFLSMLIPNIMLYQHDVFADIVNDINNIFEFRGEKELVTYTVKDKNASSKK